MTELNYDQIGAVVLTACIAEDPYSVNPDAETAKAWGRHFEKHGLQVPDLLAGVMSVYEQHGTMPNGERYRPLPKDIVDAARAVRRARADTETDAERDARALRNDERLGLDTSWYRGDSRTNDALAAERRAAIQAFAHGMAAKAIMAGPEDEAELVDTYGKGSDELAAEAEKGYGVASVVARQRASAPPVWGDPAREPMKVAENQAQPQEDPTPCPRCHYPDGYETHVCHGIDYRIGPTDG